MLIDNGVVRRADGRWRLDPHADLDALTVPETLQALILARFDRLGPAERHVLQAASVIGREFDMPVLTAVLRSLPPADVQPALDQLVEREFVQPSGEQTYEFRHVLVSDAIYGTMLRRNQGELHGTVGEALEALYPDQLEKNIELLARHYGFSPRLDRALHYLILAGQRAERAYLNRQARGHYEQALTLLPQVSHTLAQAVQVNMGLGDVLMFAGEYATARVQYQAALDVIPAVSAREHAGERAELFRKLGAAHLKQSDYEQALGAFTAAQTALAEADAPSPVAQARILNEVGWTHFERGDLEAAQATLLQGLKLVGAGPALDVVSSLYTGGGGVA
jgi:predicted ATPase